MSSVWESTGWNEVEDLSIYPVDNLSNKKVIFFLAKTDMKKISLSHEHTDFVWLKYEDAMEKITFENAKKILVKANNFC